MTPQKFDAILFDFDGVLVESLDVKTRAFASLYTEFGPEFQKKVIDFHLENGGLSRFFKFRYYHEKLLGEPLTPEKEHALGEKFSALVIHEIVAAPWVGGAREFLEAFHQTISLFIASGTPEPELRTIVERRNMRKYFTAIYGSPATKGEIIRNVLQDHSLDPKRVLMVGDAMADLEGATQAGVAFLGRLSGGKGIFPPEIPTIPDLLSLPRFI